MILDLCPNGLVKAEPVKEISVALFENGHLPHRVRGLASEGCAGEFLRNAR